MLLRLSCPMHLRVPGAQAVREAGRGAAPACLQGIRPSTWASVARAASSAPQDEVADYIVVGAGSAGCVVATRLVEAGHSVVLLEAGGGEALSKWDPRAIASRLPTALSLPMHMPMFNWGFLAEPEVDTLGGRRVTCPRGKGLGGSSAINGMVYVRGHPMDFETWANGSGGGGGGGSSGGGGASEGGGSSARPPPHDEGGAAGKLCAVSMKSSWGWAQVAPYFERLENFGGAGDGTGLRGKAGPVHVSVGRNALGTSLYDAFLRAGEEAGYGLSKDLNGFRQEGVGLYNMTVFHSGDRQGERCSAAAAYLERPASSSGGGGGGVRVRTAALARRLLWAGDDDGDEAAAAGGGRGGRGAAGRGDGGGGGGGGGCGGGCGAKDDAPDDAPRCVGVEVLDGRRFRARREVVLSCGAIGSPHLLQVSGVGDESYLAASLPGVSAKAHVPGVGRNLMDHLEVYFQFGCLPAARSLQPWLHPVRKLAIGAAWLLGDKLLPALGLGGGGGGLNGFLSGFLSKPPAGLGATNHFETGGFLRSQAGVAWPDIQIHFLPVAVAYDGVSSPPSQHGHSFQLHMGCNRSKSRGSVLAVDQDVTVPPKINFNYMSDPEDWVDFRRAIRLGRELIGQPAFDALEPVELSPGISVQSDEDLNRWLAEHLESAYHPCGTCKMGDLGSDPDAVVDPMGRVRGVGGLRVIDASIFPYIPNGNLNAPTLMVAEKLSAAMVGEPPLPPLWQNAPPPQEAAAGGEAAEEAAAPVGGAGAATTLQPEGGRWWWAPADFQSTQREKPPLRPLGRAPP